MRPNRLLIDASLVLLVASALAAADPAPSWNPFGDLSPTGIGNIPQGPNPILGIPALHLMAIDLVQTEGTPVYSVRAGIASLAHLISPDDWTTTVQVLSPDGILTYFMHLDPVSVSVIFGDHLKTGVWVEEGTRLGSLTKAPSSLHSHVHFGVVDCAHRMRINPLRYLTIDDTQAPKILSISAEKAGIDQGDVLSGSVDLTTNVLDTIDGMNGNYAPHRIEFSIRPLQGNRKALFQSVLFDASEYPFLEKAGVSHSPETNWSCKYFDEFDGYNPRLGSTLYRQIKYDPAHPERLLSFALTADTRALNPIERNWLRPHEGPWNTRLVPDGRYAVKVIASDIRGNRTVKRRVFTVRNHEVASTGELSKL